MIDAAPARGAAGRYCGLYRGRPDGRCADCRWHRLSAARRRPGAQNRPAAAGQRPGPLRGRTCRHGRRRKPRRGAGSRRSDRRRVRRPAGRDRTGGRHGRRARPRSGTMCPTISASCGSAATRRAPTPRSPGRPMSPALDFTVSRVTANSMEPRGAWACIAADGRIEVHASHQSPFALRNGMASGNFQIAADRYPRGAGRCRRLVRNEVRRASGVRCWWPGRRAGWVGRCAGSPTGPRAS